MHVAVSTESSRTLGIKVITLMKNHLGYDFFYSCFVAVAFWGFVCF